MARQISFDGIDGSTLSVRSIEGLGWDQIDEMPMAKLRNAAEYHTDPTEDSPKATET